MISPSIIITPMANDELNGPRGDGYWRLLSLLTAGRAGTPNEVGNIGVNVLDRTVILLRKATS